MPFVITILEPSADRSLVGLDQPVYLQANAVPLPPPFPPVIYKWSYKVDGGLFNVFNGTTLFAVFTTPASVAKQDGSGNKSCSKITIRCEENGNPGNFADRTFIQVSGIPALACASPLPKVTDGVSLPSATPSYSPHPQGLVDSGTPGLALMGTHDVREMDDDAATTEVTDPAAKKSCGCSSSCGHMAGGCGNPVESIDSLLAGIVKDDPKFCVADTVAMASEISQTLPGRVKVRSGCGTLKFPHRTLDLGTFFSNAADGLVSAERYGGVKRIFGWYARLIQDVSGNVAIYWGDRTVEGWTTDDGGGSYNRPRGVFGTLAGGGGGIFVRTLRDGTQYTFDTVGRIQHIKDRSTNTNKVYYDYDASNRVCSITGDSPDEFAAYFGYDASSRVNKATLFATGSPTPARTTYYDYDASSRMNKVIGPESCITYFDYDGSDNLASEIDSDNYRTYFQYSGEKIIEVNLPENAAMYFTYDDTVPDSRRTQKDGTQKTMPYRWHGMPKQATWADGNFQVFGYNEEARPTGVQDDFESGSTPYTWDSEGQPISAQFAFSRMYYFTYGTNARLTSKKDPLDRVTYWNYDATDFQKSWIDPLGNTTYFERDSSGFIVSEKDRRGNTTYFTYDAAKNRTSVKWPDLSVRYFNFNAAHELTTTIDELGNISYFDRDNRGRITKWKDFDSKITQFAFDNRSNLTTKIDRRGNAWYFQYDGLSRTIVNKTALGNVSYFNYNPGNTLANTIDPRGNPSYFYYENKRLIGRENALKEITYFTYTPVGQVNSTKDARGCVDYFTYDLFRRKTSSMDGERNVNYMDYDAIGNPAVQTDPREYNTYFYTDALDRRFSVRNPLNQLNYFYFDAESNTTCAEDALQRRTYFYFDSRDRGFCTEDTQKNRTYFTFEARSNRSSSKDARSNVTYFYQDKLSRQFSVRDALNNVSYMEFDAESNSVASKNARANTTYFAFDADNRRTSIQTPLNEFTYFTFDAAANRASVKDARGNFSYFYFDVLNRPLADEDAKKSRTYYTYDASGNRNSLKDPLSRVTYFYFDCAERNFAVLDAAGSLSYFTFDRSSNRDSLKNERGFVTYFYFDALNRQFATRNAIQALTYMEYDAVGNRTSTKDPLSRLNYFYFDSLNRLFASEDGLQKRTYFEFDAGSNTVSVKNARREFVSPGEVGIQYFTFDALNRRSSLKDEVAAVWYFDYDAVSNLSFQSNPMAAMTYWEYDADDRKVSQKDPLARTWYWTYDGVSNATSRKDGKAQVTYYQHDIVNLRDRIDYPNSEKHYFEYDLARQLTAFADPTGRTSESYDNIGRLTIRTNPGSQNLYYEYDAAGNRTVLKDPDGVSVYYVYDAANRIEGVQAPSYGGTVAYYQYTLADERNFERRKNGTLTYHYYDNTGRISAIEHRATAGVIEAWDYTRDEVGNILQQVGRTDGMNVYWNYDQANRITKEAWRSSGGSDIYGFTYTYDAAGNRSLKRKELGTPANTYWNYDLADQLVIQKNNADTRVYFAFDSNGNLAVEHDVDGSAGRTYYDYDPRNLLSRVDYPQAIATNYFYYNAPGERTRKDDSTGGKKYTWDGLIPIVEKDLANSTTQNMVKGYTPIDGIGDYLLQDVGGTVIYPHKNQVGTTLRSTDVSQVLKNTYEYDAWGQPFVASETVGQQYRFTGKELDPDFVDFNCVNRRYSLPTPIYSAFRASAYQRSPLEGMPSYQSMCCNPIVSPILFASFMLMGGDDIKFIDWVVRTFGLSLEGRDLLHDYITKQNLSKNDIKALAQAIRDMGGKYINPFGPGGGRSGPRTARVLFWFALITIATSRSKAEATDAIGDLITPAGLSGGLLGTPEVTCPDCEGPNSADTMCDCPRERNAIPCCCFNYTKEYGDLVHRSGHKRESHSNDRKGIDCETFCTNRGFTAGYQGNCSLEGIERHMREIYRTRGYSRA